MQKPNACRSTRPAGRYCNNMRVGYNAYEFVLDFGQEYDEDGEAPPHTRVVTPPPHAKAFAELLVKSLSQYEERYGPIETKTEARKRGAAGPGARSSRRPQ